MLSNQSFLTSIILIVSIAMLALIAFLVERHNKKLCVKRLCKIRVLVELTDGNSLALNLYLEAKHMYTKHGIPATYFGYRNYHDFREACRASIQRSISTSEHLFNEVTSPAFQAELAMLYFSRENLLRHQAERITLGQIGAMALHNKIMSLRWQLNLF
jgi:hypothetical protein